MRISDERAKAVAKRILKHCLCLNEAQKVDLIKKAFAIKDRKQRCHFLKFISNKLKRSERMLGPIL